MAKKKKDKRGGKRRRRRTATKADLTDAVYRRHGGLTRDEAARAVEAVFSAVKGTIGDGGRVRIRNFGVFEVADRAARRGVDPSSGERIRIPARKGLTFRASPNLKAQVDDGPDD